MLQIKNKNIYVNRGDEVTIRLSSNENFQVNDVIKLYITERGNLNNVLKTVTTIVSEESTYATITLHPADTRFTPADSQPHFYWYEIELNEIITLAGYDVNGPKDFVIYPEVTEV